MSTQRTINRSLIVHNDLDLGHGQVTQIRGASTLVEQKIELDFIFRSLDEIRYLDIQKYSHASVYTPGNGVLAKYWMDPFATDVDDANEVLAPIPDAPFGRWRKVVDVPAVYTTTELNDITNIANTSSAKLTGAQVWNSTLNRPVWAVGSGDADIWVDANGTTVHTPV